MKIFRSGFLMFGLLFCLLLVGKFGKSEAQVAKKTKPSKTLLIFEKKPCFGFCPVYKADFKENGMVEVTYQQPAKPKAQTIFKLNSGEVKTLWSRGEKLGFFKMKPRYETLRTDFPVRELTLFKKNKPKTVNYTEGASPEFDAYLVDLAALIEGKINVNFGPPEKPQEPAQEKE